MPLALIAGGRTVWAAQNDAQPNPNCALVVPSDPLSARGLATPYRLVAQNTRQGRCHESNADQAAFVQGAVLDPATGKVSVYNPLVIDDGRQPLVAPVVPKLPANAVVGLWFGFNGDTLALRDSAGSLRAGRCVNGLGNSIFGQFAYCNAPAFFQAANAAIQAGQLKIPPLGVAKDGVNCPTTRAFSAVDQDQSDNVTTSYLLRGDRSAQNTAAGRAALTGTTVQVNGSDNLLVDAFLDKALGCTPFQAPDLADHGAPATSLALNELQAAAEQTGTVALVPPNDPMVLDGDRVSVQKTNLYRAGVDQPPLTSAGNLATTYCADLARIGQMRIQLDRNLTRRVTSPDTAAATNLFTFLAQRLAGSFDQLGCDRLLNMTNPVTLKQRNGVTVDATFATPTRPVPASGVRHPLADTTESSANISAASAANGTAAGTADPDTAPDIQADPKAAGNPDDPRPPKY